MAAMEGAALQQPRHSEHLAEQRQPREVALEAQAENAARQEALKAQQALEVTSSHSHHIPLAILRC